MFKTGIYKVGQLNQSQNFKTFLGKDRKISITLLHDIVNNPNRDDIAERILFQFKDDRGAFKRTYADRFDAFDAQAVKEIQSRFSCDDDLVVHDAAVSDGRTACDFFGKLASRFPKLKYYASDYDPHLFVVQSGRTKVVLNKDGTPLEVVFPPFVFNSGKESLFYPVNRLARFILRNSRVQRIIRQYKAGCLVAKDLFLFCPRAIQLSQEDKRFHLRQHNLLNPSSLPEEIDVFRAMNILNIGYFSLAEYEVIIGNIFKSLSSQGLFITGSNQDSHSTVHGGIFRKEKDRFEKVWQSGEGSQVENTILNYRFS